MIFSKRIADILYFVIIHIDKSQNKVNERLFYK